VLALYLVAFIVEISARGQIGRDVAGSLIFVPTGLAAAAMAQMALIRYKY